MKMSWRGESGRTRSNTCSSIGLPATVMSGFGLLEVCGRNLEPSPATGRMTSTVSSADLICGHETHCPTDTIYHRPRSLVGARVTPISGSDRVATLGLSPEELQ